MAMENKLVYNHDLLGLYNRLNRILFEMSKCQSTGTTDINDYDQNRIKSYLDALDNYVAWFRSVPHLDLPETHPREYPLPEAPEVKREEIENECVADLCTMLTLARDEMCNCQSARLGSGMIDFDFIRFTNVVEKCRVYMNTYVQNVTPLDMPESAPKYAQVGQGRVGV